MTNEDVRKLVIVIERCQKVLAEHLPPDGTNSTQCLAKLYEQLDNRELNKHLFKIKQELFNHEDRKQTENLLGDNQR